MRLLQAECICAVHRCSNWNSPWRRRRTSLTICSSSCSRHSSSCSRPSESGMQLGQQQRQLSLPLAPAAQQQAPMQQPAQRQGARHQGQRRQPHPVAQVHCMLPCRPSTQQLLASLMPAQMMVGPARPLLTPCCPRLSPCGMSCTSHWCTAPGSSSASGAGRSSTMRWRRAAWSGSGRRCCRGPQRSQACLSWPEGLTALMAAAHPQHAGLQAPMARRGPCLQLQLPASQRAPAALEACAGAAESWTRQQGGASCTAVEYSCISQYKALHQQPSSVLYCPCSCPLL